MIKVFRKHDGTTVDIVDHTMSVLQKCPHATIHVGTDSQNGGDKTKYSTVIAYRLGTRGVHYIHRNFYVSKIKDKWDRLSKEAEYSIDVALWLKEKINVEIQIDLDYNEDSKFFSNKLIPMTVGWITSLGFKCNVKPNIQVATRAADHQCK
jgi:predicted RNase H-related nuclease YkuK (DUF458 family)